MREFNYDNYYRNLTEEFVDWREWGAINKGKSICNLIKNITFENVIEIGAGTGAVTKYLLNNCVEFSRVKRFVTTEISSTALRFLKDNLRDYPIVEVRKSEFGTEFKIQEFDIAICSHVLEHVSDVRRFLSELKRISKYAIIEVPLEDTLLIKIAYFIRKLRFKKERFDNPVGHVNFYTKKSLIKTLKSNHLEYMESHEYTPFVPPHVSDSRFKMVKNSTLKLLKKLVGEKIFAHIYNTHYAVICQ